MTRLRWPCEIASRCYRMTSLKVRKLLNSLRWLPSWQDFFYAGIVNGKNIWRNNFWKGSLAVLEGKSQLNIVLTSSFMSMLTMNWTSYLGFLCILQLKKLDEMWLGYYPQRSRCKLLQQTRTLCNWTCWWKCWTSCTYHWIDWRRLHSFASLCRTWSYPEAPRASALPTTTIGSFRELGSSLLNVWPSVRVNCITERIRCLPCWDYRRNGSNGKKKLDLMLGPQWIRA